jgi:catechol 2,3-dioxygenase-like lactoylglutathione lyase family enzyme
MLKQLSTVQVWVTDQDEALAFYTEKLGLELREDVTVAEMGNFRWLSVGVPGQNDVAIVLMEVPGPPVFEEETRQQILSLLARGADGVPCLAPARPSADPGLSPPGVRPAGEQFSRRHGRGGRLASRLVHEKRRERC